MPHQANTKETAKTGHLSEKPYTLQMAVILRSKVRGRVQTGGEASAARVQDLDRHYRRVQDRGGFRSDQGWEGSVEEEERERSRRTD